MTDRENDSQDLVDYSQSGLSLQYAMLDHAKRFPEKSTRPPYIVWNGLRIRTGDSMAVPPDGVVRGEFLSWKRQYEQGFDIKVDGWIALPSGKHVDLLRTWADPRYEPVVEYPYHSNDGRIRIWNVYKRPSGYGLIEEKWTGNAGFWVEEVSRYERIYHCSHGIADPPDFDSLVFKVSIY